MALLQKICLSLVPEIGDITAKRLIAYCGGLDAVFEEKKQHLLKIPGVGETHVKALNSKEYLGLAEKELKYVQQHNVQLLFYLDDAYPKRLKRCDDGPILLYFKGNCELNNQKVISIVGTRQATPYAEVMLDNFLAELSSENILVVSGLAYGVDTLAHRNALKHNLPTIGALGNGFNKIYPHENIRLAVQMQENGGILSEFTHNTEPYPAFFPKRNRIVAGMSDATLVIESDKKGGSLITANLAHGYKRRVFAAPGRTIDQFSSGCNALLENGKAEYLLNGKQFLKRMGWNKKASRKNAQQNLFEDLNPEEMKLIELLQEAGDSRGIDWLSLNSKISMNKVAGLLLNLEFKGQIKSLPGKRYILNAIS